MNWVQEVTENFEKAVRDAGDKAVKVPALSATAPIDTYDIWIGADQKFMAHNVEEKYADLIVSIWNGLLESGYKPAQIHQINWPWLLAGHVKKVDA
jgi:hypothetical protein